MVPVTRPQKRMLHGRGGGSRDRQGASIAAGWQGTWGWGGLVRAWLRSAEGWAWRLRGANAPVQALLQLLLAELRLKGCALLNGERVAWGKQATKVLKLHSCHNRGRKTREKAPTQTAVS